MHTRNTNDGVIHNNIKNSFALLKTTYKSVGNVGSPRTQHPFCVASADIRRWPHVHRTGPS